MESCKLDAGQRAVLGLPGSGILWVVTLVTLLHPGYVSSQTRCPWRGNDLLAWDDPNSWDSGEVPQNGTMVTISGGRRVLLNVSVDLKSLTVSADSELIWANIPNLELRAGYIVVNGAFHVGSKSCRIKHRVSIKLTGLSNSRNFVSDDEQVTKCILVRENGTLEMHGRKKTSWTRLAQTIPAIWDMDCGLIYNHSDYETNLFASDRSYGLHVIIWNPDASVFDYGVFQVYTSLREFISNVPNGKVIGMYAFAKNGLGNRDSSNADFATLDDVIINDLGGQLIANATKGDSYALLTRKGFPDLTMEHYKYKGRTDMVSEEAFLQLPVFYTDCAFQVAKSPRTTHNYFRVLHTDVAYPILELADRVIGWYPGDLIVVASTDYDWTQAEVREIVRCSNCSPSQIRVNATFNHRHFGNFTYHVDQRAEVGLLTRNIVVEGVMEDECYETNPVEAKLCRRFNKDTFGGHIKVLRGFQDVHIQGVELSHMGQQIHMGAYPVHFHMVDDAHGAWVRENSIHHSFSRCVTIHGTDRLEVSGNMCYDHLGHGYFMEDSAEQENIIRGNMGLGTRFGTILMSDSTKEWCRQDYYKRDYSENCAEVSTFWITHPNNDVADNAAAGGDGHGFMYVFGDTALGPSFERQQDLCKVKMYHARSYPIKSFYNNVAHSNFATGVFMDSFISSGGKVDRDEDIPLNGIVQVENQYEPRDPPGNIHGKRVWTKIERMTAYKNLQNNLWVKGGNVNVTFASLADAGISSFSGGCTGFQTGTSLEYSVVIGRSDNLGEPKFWRDTEDESLTVQFNGSVGKSPWSTVQGVAIYQGPMFVKHSHFDRFQTTYWADEWTDTLGKRPVSNAGAISFKKDSTYPTYTSQYTTNLTFGYCDNEDNGHYLYFGTIDVFDWDDTCGPRNCMNHDLDGSLTGSPDTFVVRDRPFFTGPECVSRPDWGMAVCPYRYIKVEIKGDDGNLSPGKKENFALVTRRDDAPEDPFYQRAQQRVEYLTRTHSSYLIGYNTSMEGAAFPSEVRVFGYGVERQDVVRLGLCVPLDMTSFEVTGEYPVAIVDNNYTRASSLQELDEDEERNAVFHDTENGVLFFKIWSRHDRTNDSQLCSDGHCYRLKIRFNDGTLENVRDCFDVNVPPYVDRRPPPPIPEQQHCRKGSPEGLGAVRWEEVSKIMHDDFHAPCVSQPSPPERQGRTAPEHIGCFVEETQNFTQTHTMPRTMTVDFCIARCYQRNFRYAGLTRSTVCTCSRTLNDTEEARLVKNRRCVRTCPGTPTDREKTCGNGSRLDVWSTGV